ncbi:polypeptide N-acetylgalactosaminyltransferase 9 isoform X1 [Tachysurus ichikawai]
MAAARKIKTLLTVNILVFVGIVLFSVYCRIQDRSEELVQLGRSAEARARTRQGRVTDTDRQSILQRLERLEDVVYNQLNARHLVRHDPAQFLSNRKAAVHSGTRRPTFTTNVFTSYTVHRSS